MKLTEKERDLINERRKWDNGRSDTEKERDLINERRKWDNGRSDIKIVMFAMTVFPVLFLANSYSSFNVWIIPGVFSFTIGILYFMGFTIFDKKNKKNSKKW